MLLEEGEYLEHYGILRKSGRYPWGSGKTPNQRSKTFLDIVDAHKQEGLSESKIAALYSTDDVPFTTTDLRAARARAVNIQTQERVRQAQSLKDKGMGASEIARQMGTNESSVRSLLAPGRQERLDILGQTADMLKRQVEEKGFVDVGAQVQRDLPIGDNPDVRVGISKDKFDVALSMLKEEGYSIHPVRISQVGTGEFTKYRVLSKQPQTKEGQREVFLNRDKIRTISEKSDDGGRSFKDTSFKQPLNIDPKRVGVRYKEEGGADADGVIYVRPGVKDIELGKSQYAQVRIAVGGTHYLKGMAIYKNDLPDGVDLQFNTNKSKTANKLDALKPLKTVKDTDEVDWKNPFGSFPKEGGQILGSDGKPTSAMNILNEEGDWGNWSRTLSRQVLSKQSPDLAKSQLDLTYDRRRQEFEELRALTNPRIKRKLLETFSDETDSASVHLKAANMPGQATKVLLPVSGMKPSEIFVPTMKDGDRVALVRFPHAGTFEIPELTVNNRNREARELFGIGKGGQAPDAVGIHPKVAERLSGADFDGDTVLVIPNNRGQIKSTPSLERLKGFDPQEYKVPEDQGKTIKDSRKQTEMGNVTNLISDMTIKGASPDELADAVRHSMVVIDAEKHNLDYKASERDHRILALKRKYQGVNENGQVKGASTLITRATARIDVDKRKDALAGPGLVRSGAGTIDVATGRRVYEPTGELNRNGEPKKFRSQKLAETDDAFSLVSEGRGTPIERVYAEHSNRLKDLANEARRELATSTESIRVQPSAKKVYADAVASLNSKLDTALKNAPIERQAQVVANNIVAQRRKAHPEMDKADLKKIKGQALEEARIRTGAGKTRIEITDREWDAIQAGAVSTNKLDAILSNTDVDKLKTRATPRDKPVMSPVITRRAKAMLGSGYTLAEVSDALGISASTLQSGVAEGGE